MRHNTKPDSSRVQRFILTFVVLSFNLALLGYMELRFEVEHIDPDTALVTNHFTGEVRRCRTYRNADWSCTPTDLKPRPFVFALVPFWPARTLPGNDARAGDREDARQFRRSRLAQDLVYDGAIVLILLLLSIYLLRPEKAHEGGAGGRDGGE